MTPARYGGSAAVPFDGTQANIAPAYGTRWAAEIHIPVRAKCSSAKICPGEVTTIEPRLRPGACDELSGPCPPTPVSQHPRNDSKRVHGWSLDQYGRKPVQSEETRRRKSGGGLESAVVADPRLVPRGSKISVRVFARLRSSWPLQSLVRPRRPNYPTPHRKKSRARTSTTMRRRLAG